MRLSINLVRLKFWISVASMDLSVFASLMFTLTNVQLQV
jgi:hypothetical protein